MLLLLGKGEKPAKTTGLFSGPEKATKIGDVNAGLPSTTEAQMSEAEIWTLFRGQNRGPHVVWQVSQVTHYNGVTATTDKLWTAKLVLFLNHTLQGRIDVYTTHGDMGVLLQEFLQSFHL